jgi:hypothetical protein
VSQRVSVELRVSTRKSARSMATIDAKNGSVGGTRSPSSDLLADPGILPCHRYALIVAAKQKVDAIVVTDFYGLVFVQPVGACYFVIPTREPVCRVFKFCMPFKLVTPPNHKLPSSDNHSKGFTS